MGLLVKKIFNYSLLSVVITLIFQRCAVYSFSGISLSPEVKNFSIRSFSVDVAGGGSDLGEEFTNLLRDELLQRTSLSQSSVDGDIQFQGSIKEFKYTPIAPSAGSNDATLTRLTITVEVTYTNPYNKKSQWKKRRFSQYADMSSTATIDTEQNRLVKEIFDKLIQDIFNASVASW